MPAGPAQPCIAPRKESVITYTTIVISESASRERKPRSVPGRAGVAHVGFRELDQAWSNQMIECMTVDSENNSRYYNTYGEISAEELIRLGNFLRRHNLFVQFLADDAQGKR